MIKILLLILFVASSLAGILYFSSKRSERNQMNQQGVEDANELIGRRRKKSRKQKLYLFYQKSYIYASRIIFLRKYIRKVRQRLSAVHAYDELTMRRETMRITFFVLGGLSFAVLFLSFFGNDLTFAFFVLLGAIVLNGTLIEHFVNKVADRLLLQQTELLEDIRHFYNEHQMVDEAIGAAAEVSNLEIATHAKKIYEAITTEKPEEKLEAYYEVAPNRFLKLFAGLSHLVKEYGDKKLKDRGSLYLYSLNRLKGEIFDEVLYRKRLRYLLNSLTIMTIVPIFFLKPIEMWARYLFPSMADFYNSKLGFIVKIALFMIVLLSYIFIRRIHDTEDTVYAKQRSKHTWLKALYKKKTVAFVVDKFMPSKTSKKYSELERLLKETNSSLTLEWFFLQRILTCVLAVVVSISLFIYMHSVAAEHTRSSNPFFQQMMFAGQVGPNDEKRSAEVTDFDRRIIDSMKGVREDVEENVAYQVQKELGKDATTNEITHATIRLTNKILVINKEYFKWWELLICLGIGAISFRVPLWLLLFQKRMRQMQMKVEVNQMHTIIGIMSEFERVSAENILTWMERFATIFETPLKTCILNFDSGPMAALEELTVQAPFPPFVRTIERLQNALERVTIQEAFADLETDRAYFLEEKKLENERVLNKKVTWGRYIGLAPLNAVVLLYLVFPLIYLSVLSSTTLYEQFTTTTF